MITANCILCFHGYCNSMIVYGFCLHGDRKHLVTIVLVENEVSIPVTLTSHLLLDYYLQLKDRVKSKRIPELRELLQCNA